MCQVCYLDEVENVLVYNIQIYHCSPLGFTVHSFKNNACCILYNVVN